jgi:hypothetical protein
VGELPNSHGRTSTDQSYVLHGIPYNSSKPIVPKVNAYHLKYAKKARSFLTLPSISDRIKNTSKTITKLFANFIIFPRRTLCKKFEKGIKSECPVQKHG